MAGDALEPGRLASLAAWRSLVEDVREWPISAPALLRFGLFVLLGLGCAGGDSTPGSRACSV